MKGMLSMLIVPTKNGAHNYKIGKHLVVSQIIYHRFKQLQESKH